MDSEPEIPPEIWEALGAFALAAGGANVIMQLARLPVGHGVARSRVDSGRVDLHPIKRARTTVAYLAVALMGTDGDRLAYRHEVNRAHRHVHSRDGDPVVYDAFDPELQLWVAACLYKGTEDVLRYLHGADLPPDRAEVVYQYGKRLGTTLQVPEAMWPARRSDFTAYWEAGEAAIAMDETTRRYLQEFAGLGFVVAPLGRLGAPFKPLLRALGHFLMLGYLPVRFRDELQLPWSEAEQRRFEAVIRGYAAVTRRLPGSIRRFPMNAYLADTRWRIRHHRPIV